MSEITIRLLKQDEVLSVLRPMSAYAFRATPPLPEPAEWQKYYPPAGEASYFAVFEDEKPVASAASFPMTLNIRGQLYAGNGLGVVSTHPTGRRKGYARQMLSSIFAQLYEQGVAISTLYPFRESFYTRLGYTTFTQPKRIRFAPQPLQPLLKKSWNGAVELLDIAQGYDLYQEYIRTRLPQIHGMGLFSPNFKLPWRDKNGQWLAIARVDGTIKGMMTYKISGHGGTLEASQFWYDDIQGRYLLLEWLARHIDHVQTVEMILPPFERPETWWPDLNVQVSSIEPPLGRIIAIDKLAGVHTGAGSFSARIHDEYCPWNNGTYRFATHEGQLQISPSATADCELSIQALTSLIYGTNEPATFALRGWGDPSTELQTVFSRMFPLQQPYLFETF
ncbi:GNAT family N-acetyltransferase [Dictyobacter arantiisoli]|uniref:Acetyltransferase n=1 Tax=Dictyobacter arantiisoli TaxID=2014874 RepID=A0A5A5TD37_9CHLR|nr:GNAT family N-acetyltransferase [Dictyobacter arantiisoli]GCF09115.1 acetyltransferase [Dictyobacter arantiisoli]